MTGKLPPETVKPAPEIASALMETAVLPFEVSVRDLVTAVPTDTLPKANEVVLRVKDGVPTAELEPPSWMEAVLDVEP